LNEGQQLFGVAMQKAVIADPAKAFGQNVLQHKPQEIFAFERAIAGFAGTAFHILESDVAILTGGVIVFRDDAPV